MAFALGACPQGMLEASVVQQWTLEPIPLVELGPEQGFEWGHAGGARLLPSDGIVVADQLERTLSIFDSGGSLSATVGGQGDGPGEFRILLEPMTCAPGELHLWDQALARITVFAEDGRLLRDAGDRELFGEKRGTPGTWKATRMACNERGVFARVSRASGVDLRADGPAPVEVVVDLATKGGPIARLGPFAGEEVYRHERAVATRPLGRRTIVRVGPSRIVVGITSEPVVDLYTLDGALESHLRLDLPRRPVTGAVVDALVRTKPERHRAVWRSFEYPDSLPLYSDLLVDPEGRLWFEEYTVGEPDSRRWCVYDRAGRRIAGLEVDGGFRILDVGVDRVIGVAVDALGVQTVRVHALRKPG